MIQLKRFFLLGSFFYHRLIFSTLDIFDFSIDIRQQQQKKIGIGLEDFLFLLFVLTFGNENLSRY